MHTTNLGSIGLPGRRPSHEQDSGIQRSHGRHCVACPASAEDSVDYRHVHRLDRMIHKQTLSFNNERFSGYSYESLMWAERSAWLREGIDIHFVNPHDYEK
jgi:hypothetical protein